MSYDEISPPGTLRPGHFAPGMPPAAPIEAIDGTTSSGVVRDAAGRVPPAG